MNGTPGYPNWLKAFPPEPAPDAHGPRRIPRRKKKPGKRSTNNRNVGKLEGIVKIPLDVFYEVVSYLHPSDLLRISRVSKHFRSMLMTRSALTFWRAARRNIGMPDPPPDLNDAQYVALIFEHVCNACGARVEWCKILSLKVQLCKKCNWHNIEGVDRISRDLKISLDDFDWSLVLLVEDLLVHDWKDNATYMVHRSIRPDKIAYVPQVKSVMNRLSTLEGDDREAYIERQRRMVRDTLDFIRRYNAWEMKRQAERLSEEARRQAIVYERLEALGHDRRDMRWDDDTDWGKLFTEGGEINETYWRRSMLPSLEREIANWKGSRMVDELCERLALRYAEFMMLLNEFLPEYSDMNPVHPPRTHWRQPASLFELLRRDDARIPVTRAFLEEHRNAILDVVTEYNRNLRADLIQMAFEDPLGPAKPIAITEEKALEILKSTSTLFVKRERYTELRMSKLYTYHGLIEDIRRDFRYDELELRHAYGGYNSYGWTDELLEKLGLDEGATWDVVESKQAEKPLVCLCGKPSFRQPASFIDLLSHILEESDWHFDNIHTPKPSFDHDHNIFDLSKLKRIIVQLDTEKGPSLGALLEKYKQKLIKRSKKKGIPDFMYVPAQGFRCFDCRSYGTIMKGEVFQWHCLTKHLKYIEGLPDI